MKSLHFYLPLLLLCSFEGISSQLMPDYTTDIFDGSGVSGSGESGSGGEGNLYFHLVCLHFVCFLLDCLFSTIFA